MGIGADTVTAEIHLSKDNFLPGEVVKINLNVDNSRCSKDLKSCRVKLYRDF